MECTPIKNFVSTQKNKVTHFSAQPFSKSAINLSLSALIVGLSLNLTACGGGSTEEAIVPVAEQLPDETGEVVIVIRDDEEDFLSYDIDVLSIDLVREDGTQVSVAPNSARVDFIQYTELSELFSINTVPAGRYNQISFTLDYSTANIIIQDENGESYQATAQNSEGEAITVFPLSLVLDDNSPLIIKNNKMAAITLDLDLATTNQVLSFEPAIVQVEPFVNVSIDTEGDREHRARGLLQSVDTQNSTLTLSVKPLRKTQGDFGEVTLSLGENTLYEIDGSDVESADALASLASLAVDTPIVAFGSVGEEHVFTASKLLAGTSVAWAGKDAFRGVITARSEEGITISGIILEPEDKQAVHGKDFTLSYNEATKFTGFNQQEISSYSLSIGQHIKALGQFEEENFDAGDSVVHIKLSQVTGQVVQTSPLIIDVAKLNRKPADSYSFSGTGLTPEQDADPEHYEIGSNNLNINALAAQDWLTVRGYINDYGQAPEDFMAKSLIKKDLTQAYAHFKAHWKDGTATFSVDAETKQITWDQSEARQKIHVRGVPHNLAKDSIIQAINSDVEEGRFAIKEGEESIKYFAKYADFVSELTAELALGKLVKQVNSKGTYDEEIQGIKAVAISIVLQ